MFLSFPFSLQKKVRKRGEAGGGRGGVGERVRVVGKNAPRIPGPRGGWEALLGYTFGL